LLQPPAAEENFLGDFRNTLEFCLNISTIALVNLQKRYLSYHLGLAWWAEAGLKIVALSMFMATAVFAIIACLTARFLLLVL